MQLIAKIYLHIDNIPNAKKKIIHAINKAEEINDYKQLKNAKEILEQI